MGRKMRRKCVAICDNPFLSEMGRKMRRKCVRNQFPTSGFPTYAFRHKFVENREL